RRAAHRPVVGLADGGRPEPGPGAERRAPIEWRAEAHHLAVAEGVEAPGGHPEEAGPRGERDVFRRRERDLFGALLVRRMHHCITVPLPDRGANRRGIIPSLAVGDHSRWTSRNDPRSPTTTPASAGPSPEASCSGCR